MTRPTCPLCRVTCKRSGAYWYCLNPRCPYAGVTIREVLPEDDEA